MTKVNIGTINKDFNIGDLIFTLFSLGFLALIVLSVIWLLGSNKKRKNQLNNIENKIDALSEKVNKRND